MFGNTKNGLTFASNLKKIKKMKKALSFLFVASMITLASCGGKTEEAATDAAAAVDSAATAVVDSAAAVVDSAAAVVDSVVAK
jgi:hypothetical protein